MAPSSRKSRDDLHMHSSSLVSTESIAYSNLDQFVRRSRAVRPRKQNSLLQKKIDVGLSSKQGISFRTLFDSIHMLCDLSGYRALTRENIEKK